MYHAAWSKHEFEITPPSLMKSLDCHVMSKSWSLAKRLYATGQGHKTIVSSPSPIYSPASAMEASVSGIHIENHQGYGNRYENGPTTFVSPLLCGQSCRNFMSTCFKKIRRAVLKNIVTWDLRPTVSSVSWKRLIPNRFQQPWKPSFLLNPGHISILAKNSSCLKKSRIPPCCRRYEKL